MKKIMRILSLLFIVVLTISCESQEDIENDIKNLKSVRSNLEKDVKNLSYTIKEKKEKITSLSEKVKELGIYESNKTPHYILKLKLKQSRVSLSVSKHIKDAINAIEFELPVDKDFYHSVNVGTKITDKFRAGSFVINGSFSNWNMTVESKIIK